MERQGTTNNDYDSMERFPGRTMTRRGFLSLMGSAVIASALLAACGGDDDDDDDAGSDDGVVADAATTADAGAADAATEADSSSEDEPTEAEEDSGAADGEPVTITWMHWWENEWGDQFTKLVDGFQAANPNITLESVFVPYPEMSTKLTAAAAAGDTSYDFYGIEGSWIPGLLDQGYIEPLNQWLEGDPETADRLVETAGRVFAGDTYSLVLYQNVYQFAYNVDVFEEEGLEPPTNWDEFVTVLEALRDKDANKYGMSMPLQDGGFILTRYFGFRLAQEGGTFLDDDGNVAFNGPEGVRALEWWRDFYQKDLVVPGSMGEDQTLMLEFIATGQTSAIIDGPFILSKAQQYDPEIRLAYAPAWTAETGGYLWAGSGLAINAKSEKKDAVWKFFQYMYSDEVSIDMTQAVSYPWATKAAMASLSDSDDPMLSQIPAMANQDPEHNIGYPVLPNGTEMVEAIRLAFQEVLEGKKEAQEALDEAAKVWQDNLDSVGS